MRKLYFPLWYWRVPLEDYWHDFGPQHFCQSFESEWILPELEWMGFLREDLLKAVVKVGQQEKR